MFYFSCCRNIDREHLTYLAGFEGRNSNPVNSTHRSLNNSAKSHPISNKICALTEGVVFGPLAALAGLGIHRVMTMPSAFNSLFGSTSEICASYATNTVKHMLNSSISQAWEMGKSAAANLADCAKHGPTPAVFAYNAMTVITDAIAENPQIALGVVVAATALLTLRYHSNFVNRELESKERLIVDLTNRFTKLSGTLENDDLDDKVDLAKGILGRKEEIKHELSELNTLSADEINAITKHLFDAARAVVKKE